MPAHMSHFALQYPEKPQLFEKHRLLLWLPYLISALLSVPYLYFFFTDPLKWHFWESVVIIYAAVSYIIWLLRLERTIRVSQYESHRIDARYLLVGQIFGFVTPLVLGIYVVFFEGRVSLNWATLATLVLPLSALFGLILGRLKITQTELVHREKMASLGQLMSGIAHEINNPTTFIYSNIAPLKDYIAYLKDQLKKDALLYKDQMTVNEVMDDLEKLADNIQEGALRTRNIVKDLRAFGHSQEDIYSLFNVYESIESVLHMLEHTYEGRVNVDIKGDLQAKIFANQGQISQVWMNLLSNAIGAIDNAGKIEITIHDQQHTICVSIKDSGKGMTKKELKRIFDPFYTTKVAGEGTGLGLSLVQKICQKMNAKIDVKSNLNRGSEFIIYFPKQSQ